MQWRFAKAVTTMQCCLLACSRRGQQPDLQITIWPPPDSEPSRLWAHTQCFEASRSPTVPPDLLQDHGHVPSKARCLFCGESLPIVGHHPYVLDVGEAPSRYWAHPHCLADRVVGLPPSTRGTA